MNSDVGGHISACHHQEAFCMSIVMVKADYMKSNQHIY